ncbi:HdeD family acid-resistance protein [Devosia sp. CN2-171]|uniref:HdeD family acid-resistance protein n=1 Tax=Devosia sp. CN2-171 TaxID=3400909 RepID=UPI003BF82DEC
MAGESTVAWPSIFAGIRGVLMLAGGIFALFWPAAALATLVWLGGLIIIVDGALGIWALLFGGRTSPRIGVAITRHVLAIIFGIIVLLFPAIVGAIGLSTLVILVAIMSLLVGAMALYVTVVSREVLRKGTFWPEVLSACAYLVFGLLLLFMPLTAALVLVSIVGVLMVLYGLFQLYIAWQLRGVGVVA